MKTVFFLISFITIQSFAAICSCDAPPSCGSRPTSCFNYEATLLLGKTFVEKGVSSPRTLTFTRMANSGALHVNFGRILDRSLFASYLARLTSENSFDLYLYPPSTREPQFVGHFTFEVHYFPTSVNLVRSSDGSVFALRVL